MTKECLEPYTDGENPYRSFLCRQIRASQVSRLSAKSHILNDSSLRPVRGKSLRETARGECRLLLEFQRCLDTKLHEYHVVSINFVKSLSENYTFNVTVRIQFLIKSSGLKSNLQRYRKKHLL